MHQAVPVLQQEASRQYRESPCQIRMAPAGIDEKNIEVKEGTTTKTLGKVLKKQNLIKNLQF